MLYGWPITHLHGARTAAMYDGWTENAMLPPRTETDGTNCNASGETRPGVVTITARFDGFTGRYM